MSIFNRSHLYSNDGGLTDLSSVKIGALQMNQTELHQLLVAWNQTDRDYPKNRTIHQLFEDQVTRTPDAIAVIFNEQYLTYNELNTQANRLAHYLRGLGVGPEACEGICMKRSLNILI
jgi:non-ribosomal peptide synthetase component F